MTARPLIQQLRAAGWAEGASYLVLLGVAMPLKYLYDRPMAVRAVGMAHGIFFLLYLVAASRAGWARRWSAWSWVEALGAAVVPFGPFLLDRKLRRELVQSTAAGPGDN